MSGPDGPVTVGRGRDTHEPDGRPYPDGRTLCGRFWTDEHPPEAPVTCRTCRKIAAKLGA